jgi:hypothetical protein
MKPHASPGEGTEPIDYEPPRVLEDIDIEVRLLIPPGTV